MNAPLTVTEPGQDTRQRYRANLPRHLLGIARHLQSEVMHALTQRGGDLGLQDQFGLGHRDGVLVDAPIRVVLRDLTGGSLAWTDTAGLRQVLRKGNEHAKLKDRMLKVAYQ